MKINCMIQFMGVYGRSSRPLGWLRPCRNTCHASRDISLLIRRPAGGGFRGIFMDFDMISTSFTGFYQDLGMFEMFQAFEALVTKSRKSHKKGGHHSTSDRFRCVHKGIYISIFLCIYM